MQMLAGHVTLNCKFTFKWVRVRIKSKNCHNPTLPPKKKLKGIGRS